MRTILRPETRRANLFAEIICTVGKKAYFWGMTKIYKDFSAFLAREDNAENGVSEQFAADNPEWDNQNEENNACWNCSRCSGCSGCYDCSDCSGCSRCSGLAPQKIENKIPVIPNIHASILEAASKPGALNMGQWHCGTSHCRAGWVVTLAGGDGRKLEERTSTLFAAMQIYHASCPSIPVSTTRFFGSNEEALKDMERCAKEEIEISK